MNNVHKHIKLHQSAAACLLLMEEAETEEDKAFYRMKYAEFMVQLCQAGIEKAMAPNARPVFDIHVNDDFTAEVRLAEETATKH
jgi:hypothetical protein